MSRRRRQLFSILAAGAAVAVAAAGLQPGAAQAGKPPKPTKVVIIVVDALSKEIVDILKQKDVTDRMLSEGTVPTPSGPDEFTAYIKSELKKWGDVVKMAGIKAD